MIPGGGVSVERLYPRQPGWRWRRMAGGRLKICWKPCRKPVGPKSLASFSSPS